MHRALPVTVAIVLVAACSQAPAAGPSLPTAPSLPAANGNRRVVFGEESTRTDFAACLDGASRCFSAFALSNVPSADVTAAPINLTAAVNGNTVFLAWTPPSSQDAPVTSYVVEVGSASGFAVPDLATFDTGNPLSALTAPGVPVGIYYARVRARNALGLSAASNEVQIVVGGNPRSCPGPPRSLTTGLTGNSVWLSWLAPLVGTAQSYIVEAGSAPGLANLANFDTRSSNVLYSPGVVPPGVYYLRVRSRAAGCSLSEPSNEAFLAVPAPPPPTGGSPLVTLILNYTCNPCVPDPDNYALNVACVRGRCSSFRAANPLRSPNTITASVRLAPGVHEIEVVVRNASSPWNVTFSGGALNQGGVVPGSFMLLYPPGGNVSLGRCNVSSREPEAVFNIRVGPGAPPSVC